MTAGFTVAEADTRLHRARTEADALTRALTELQDHPGYRFLDSAHRTGVTEKRWSAARELVPTLWTAVGQYRGVLEQAEAVRDRRHRPGPAELTELAALLDGPSVVLGTTVIPLERRGMTGPTAITQHASLAQLVAELTNRYAEVVAVVTAAQAVLDAHAGPLDELTEQLTAARARIGALDLAETGHPVVGALDRLDQELTGLRELVFSDPIALSDNGDPAASRLAALRGELARVGTELADLAAFHADSAQRLGRVAADLDALAAAESAAVAAVRATREKIAPVNLPAPADSVAVLRARLAEVTQRAGGADWLRAADELTGLADSVRAAEKHAERVRELAVALLDRRTELRGRLEAYQAKAGRLGLAEDGDLDAGHRLAHDHLWSSPTDLAAATRALNAYQRLITERESAR
jgi:hypothetical protein